jgi:cytochrome c oxidase cbb3-type subunit 3
MIWLAALFFLQLPQMSEVQVGDKNPYTTQADLAQGKKLYGGRCAGCHGPGGEGGKGANLAVPLLPRAAENSALYLVIRYGIPETEMPGSNMTPREIWQLATFVRTLGRLSAEAVHGDAARGSQLVHGKGGCLQCHAIGLEGGRTGPTLTDIGVRRGPSHLRAKLLDPVRDIPDQFRIVELKTREGQAVSGVRLNEDSWSIQVRGFDDKLHSFWKQDLTQLKVERRTVMPSYREKFNDGELNDIIAYLAGLRGAQ